MSEFEKMILKQFSRLGMSPKVSSKLGPDPLQFGNQSITYNIGGGIFARFTLDRSQIFIELSPSNQTEFYSYIDVAKALEISDSSHETAPWEELLEQIERNKRSIATAFAVKNWSGTKEKIIAAAHDRLRWLY